MKFYYLCRYEGFRKFYKVLFNNCGHHLPGVSAWGYGLGFRV